MCIRVCWRQAAFSHSLTNTSRCSLSLQLVPCFPSPPFLPPPYLHLLVHHHSTTPSSSNPFNIRSGHGSQICHPWGGGTPICPRPVCTLPVVVPWQDDRFPSWCTSWPPIVFWNKAVLLKRRLYIQLSKFIVDRRLSIAISFHP